jgi:twitching motility protein PilT
MGSCVMTFDEILATALSKGASDVLIGGNERIRFRIGGRFTSYGENKLEDEQVTRMLYGILMPWQIERLEAEKQCDLSVDRGNGQYRFRVNLYYRRGGLAAVIRPIPLRMPSLDELGIQDHLIHMLERTAGLILVAGRVGSGKSTMCAAFLEHLNATKECHIVTMEDPIEYVFTPKMGVISQREMREHALSFQDALKSVLRQSPDVIYVGEMRDMATIASTMAVAETGHLVIANLHTANAPQTISRIIDVFPPDTRALVSVQLANCLTAVICQVLVQRMDGKGLVAAREVMLNNVAMSNTIRKNELHQLYGQMESSHNAGMRTMERSLAELHISGQISYQVALSHSAEPEALMHHIDRMREEKNAAGGSSRQKS